MRRALATAVSLLLLLLGLTACNLVAAPGPSASAPAGQNAAPEVQVNIVTATPLAGVLVPTPAPVAGGAQAAPGTPATATNAADWFIGNVVIPAWNFVYSFAIQMLTSLFDYAGARGGILAQGACCVGPILLTLFIGGRTILARVRGR